jgi:hypothetical protein
MATTQNCTFKSVTLAAGEQFILPPGAEIVATTNGLEDYTSTCPKPSSLETIQCYKSAFADVDELGGHLPAYCVVTIQGININGSLYPFTTGFTFNTIYIPSSFVTGLTSAINTTLIGSLITNITVTGNYQTNGEYFTFTFNTLSSIGTNMVFYGIADGGRTGGPSFSIQYPVSLC